MKKNICILDNEVSYIKKFNNLGNKIYGKDYTFLYFSNVESLLNYSKENNINCLVLSNEYIKKTNEINTELKFILSDKNNVKNINCNYIYKYQNALNILSEIDNTIKKNDINISKIRSKTKIILFYSPYTSKDKLDMLYKLYKFISKTCKVLIIDIDEYSNYKSTLGFSNIIYKYKENVLNIENIKQEIQVIDNINIIKGVQYPEDMSVITNAELSDILLNFRELEYDYIFVNCDESYYRNQFLITECDKLLIFDGNLKNNIKVDVFIKYLNDENIINTNKIYHFDKQSKEKVNLTFIKGKLDNE